MNKKYKIKQEEMKRREGCKKELVENPINKE